MQQVGDGTVRNISVGFTLEKSDLQAKSLGQMQDDLRTTKAGIAPLESADGLDQNRRRPFGSGLALGVGRVEQ